MDIAAADLAPDRIYKLLVSTVMPRPIALVSTLNEDGSVNAAPFSFFNVFSDAPPLLVIGVEGNRRGDGKPHKDTGRNIAARGEFVVNLVSRAIVEQAVVCAVDFAEGVSELTAAGFTARPAKQIATPGIAESPVSFECRVFSNQALPNNRSLIAGEIVHLHLRDDLIDEKMQVDVARLDLVGRMHGSGWYTTTRERFQVPRMSVAEWEQRKPR